ncbi:Probable long-chain-alcohol O-fatty-acyltransferase [Seminavis robusta]|uniref:Probable long-chain-alcohol O-fatty-acyltransferase n=1 Tax=Seminavis robusta TaxID=568900 RepID=A0A9N8ESY0_9STRA|nr:Probable long-chain-alcohol O-fatty-acyltransferase [Seminavis robusta]|eukprot:Sro2012_g310940.1 Probable long-chain-alcohol O-fatty-acyltransferase (312) ;mRNA; r:16434-17691
MLMGQAGSMFVVFFRTLMAIHGTMPPYVERSWKNFVLFFVAPVQFKFDPKTGDVLPSSSEDFRSVLFKTAKGMALLCVLLGLLIHHSYELFPSPEAKTLFDLFRWSHLLSHLLNNYAMASLTGMGLASGSLVVGTIIQGLTGTTVIELTNSPMTQSTSVSDFWSRRWNSLVHLVLKGGVYVPMRKNGFPASVAAFVTFAASGIFHEYVLTALAMKARVLEDDSFYTPKYGYHLAFFAWNGLAIMMEHAVSDHPFVRWMKNNLPRPVITTLVICTVLPVGHWFTDEYVRIGFFDEIALGLPVMVWIPASQNE